MWSNMSVFSASLAVLLMVTVPLVSSEHEYFFCGHGKIVRGKENTIQSMCDNQIYINKTLFESDKFPYMLDVQLSAEDGTLIVNISNTINKADFDGVDNNDFTGVVPSSVLPIEDGECDNRGVNVLFTLSGFTKSQEMERSLKRRILCDFSDVDVELTFDDPSNPPVITLDETILTLKNAMSAGFDFTVTSNVVGSLPSLSAPSNDLGLPLLQPGYFVTAFITRIRDGMVVTRDECEGATDPVLPEISAYDTVVATEHFTTLSELQAIDILGRVKANEDELGLCGSYVLVLMIDPLHTLWNEVDRCNNFLTLRLNSTRGCDTIIPQCEVIMNPWTAGDVRAIYKGANELGPVVRMFEIGESWVKETDEDDWLEKTGYGRLMVFTGYILKNVDTTSCSEIPDPSQQLSDMEGSEPEETDSVVLPDDFSLAKTKLGQIKDKTASPSEVSAEMENMLKAIISSTPKTFGEKVRKNITMWAIMQVINATQQMQSVNTADINMEQDYCSLAWEMESARWLYDSQNDYMYNLDPEHHIGWLAGKLAAAVVANPQWKCLENLLKRLVDYADKVGTGDSDTDMPIPRFLFDDASLKEESPKSLSRCGKTNKCIKKFQRSCQMKYNVYWQPLEDSKDEICKLFIMKKSASYLYKALGMFDIFEELQSRDEEEGRYCRRDPLKPEFGPVTLSKITVDTSGQYLSVGVPDFDNTQIAWTKKAVCRCQSCESGSTGSEGPMTGGLTDPPSRRRRRK